MFKKKKNNITEEQVVIDNIVYTTEEKSDVVKEKQKKINARKEIALYDSHFKESTFWKIYIISIIAIIGLGIGFQLSWPFLLIVVAACAFCTPKIIVSLYRNKYEERKFIDTTSYIEQMLYSFRRNSKILASLNDTLTMFPEGHMKDTIREAIKYITTSSSSGNVYEEALAIIEKEYDCRRIRSLHRYLTKVEGAGGNHDMGIHALITDRRLWIDRINDFKKEKATIIKDIIIATIFSSAIILITMYMLPQDVGASKHIVARLVSTAYIVVSLLNIKAMFSRTVLYLNDIDGEAHDKAIVKKMRWYKNYDEKVEQRKAIKPVVILGVMAVGGILFNSIVISIVAVVLALFAFFVQPKLNYKTAKKRLINEIEKSFPDWLLELALLLQTDNLHVALEKTLDAAPAVLKDDLQELADGIAANPNALEPYINFLNYLPLPNIHSAMKLMYSIAEFGSEEEEKQIQELIERNSVLMDKAEKNKNDERLSKVFILKFIPMGASVMKMIADMGVFIILFISTAMTNFG